MFAHNAALLLAGGTISTHLLYNSGIRQLINLRINLCKLMIKVTS